MIEVNHLTYKYKVFERSEGIIGALKDFFNRQYEYKEALSNISFTIKQGEIVGLLGPNGAGKTTLIKILTGILSSETGEVVSMGHTPYNKEKAYLKDIGVVLGQKSQLMWDLPARETLSFLRVVYEINNQEYEKRTNELVKLFALEDKINIPVRKLSMGERIKFEIICSLIHNPKVLFLDEPTIGLDLPSQVAIRDFLKEINHRNQTTIIITSHNMQDIENVCERVIVLTEGQILDDLPINKLIEKYTSHEHYIIEFKDAVPENLIEYKDSNNTIRCSIEEYNQLVSDLNFTQIISLYREKESFESIIYRLFKNKG